MPRSGLRAVIWPGLRVVALVAAGCIGGLVVAAPARADFYTPSDGYAADGSYRVHVELAPYFWLPASQTNYSFGPQGGISGGASAGLPTVAQLKNSLHGAFMGYTLLRYGPWSAELDFEWVNAASSNKSVVAPGGRVVPISLSASVVQIAPGLGYEVFNGPAGGVPVTVDARVGFAALIWSASASSQGNVLGGLNGGSSFVQPWLGTRIQIYPAPRWRIDLGGLVQGFGVNGGSWGWGASALVGYGVTRWMAITGGFRALKSSRSEEVTGVRLSATRTIDMVAYGPVLGLAFRF